MSNALMELLMREVSQLRMASINSGRKWRYYKRRRQRRVDSSGGDTGG